MNIGIAQKNSQSMNAELKIARHNSGKESEQKSWELTNMNLEFLQRIFCVFTFWVFLQDKKFNRGQNTP